MVGVKKNNLKMDELNDDNETNLSCKFFHPDALYLMMPRRDMRLKYRRCVMRIDTGRQESVSTRVSPGEDGIVQTGSKLIHIVTPFPPASLNLFALVPHRTLRRSREAGLTWSDFLPQDQDERTFDQVCPPQGVVLTLRQETVKR